MAEQTKSNKTKGLATIGIIISWVTFWLFLISPIGLLAWIGILVYLIYKRSPLKWYFLLSAWLFVPACSFVKGTVHYATGTAFLQGIGGPPRFVGIDRDTRLNSTSSGCIVLGFEPFVFPANNAAVKLCTNVFGYQRGAYTGAFPSQEEALDILKNSDTIIPKLNARYLEFKLAGNMVRIDTNAYTYKAADLDTVIGTAVKNECFVFRPVEHNEDVRYSPIYLIDIRKNELIKSYFDRSF
jgi:hypothetical protein